MFRKTLGLLCASTALSVALPSVAIAQEAPAEAAVDYGEIVVSARREKENLQNVPVSVQAVSGDTLKRLAITNAKEISKLAPGLTLSENSPDNPIVILRGVRWAPGSGTPAIPIYLNEAGFDPANTIQSIFDVEQIEVLRGPQGTSRGAPSISGAVTITTRHPDLDDIGGYVQGQFGQAGHVNVQGAINFPIVQGRLAVRIAANIEDSELNRIYSINSTLKPKLRSRTERFTLLWQASDTLKVEGMYQRKRQLSRYYTQVVGTGSPGFAALRIPANFNGPALTLKDRRSVNDGASFYYNSFDLFTVNASWEVLGHVVSYNHGSQIYKAKPNRNAQDTANVAPGLEIYNIFSQAKQPSYNTNEIRISSQTNPDHLIDYDFGWYSKHSDGNLTAAGQNLTPGALGAPFVAVPGQVTTPDSRYIVNSLTTIGIGQKFDSFYGNVRVHLGSKTELSGGLSIIRDRVPVFLNVQTTSALVAFARFLPAAAGGCPSPLLPNSIAYGAGFCDVTVPARNTNEPHNDKYNKKIYNISLSHRFSDNLMVYATTGSSFRTGLPAINNDGLPAALTVPKPETAKSYELGVKTNFGRRFKINADIFQIDYKNQLTQAVGIPYFNTVGSRVAQTGVAFYTNVDARVRGAELDLSVQPLANLFFGANLSYSKIKSRGGAVPCTDPTRPITAANPINLCASPKGQTLNASSPFQASVNGSYSVPMGPVEAYVRFNVNYQNRNPNFSISADPTPGYSIVDLFAGITGNDEQWDLGIYAKNVFNKQVQLNRTPVLNSVYALFAAPTGYSSVNSNLPREVGATLRFSFGSR